MQLRHFTVVAAENSEQIATQVILVRVRQAADDGAVHADIGWVGRIGGVHKDVARMHVGMKEAVLKHLGEKNLHAAFAQQLQVGTPGTQRLNIGDGNARYTLHGQHVAAGVVPVNLGYIEQLVVLEIASQLAGVGGLAAMSSSSRMTSS